MRSSLALSLAVLLIGQALGAVIGPPRKPYEDLPSDEPRTHVETIDASPHGYRIEMRGTVDGVMTRMPVGYGAFQQGWQPNRFVRIDNVGPTDVRNPRIVVGGKRNWWTVQDVVAEATRGAATPADRARAIWEFRRRSRFHACTWDGECSDLLKALCIYGYTLCGDEALVINDLWKAAGFTTRRGHPVGHCVTEVFYDGAYHLLDGDEHVICLKRDNRTIASEEEVVRDHDLMKRTHTYSILAGESRQTDEFSASLYGHEGKREGDWGTYARHAMDLVLRPGESIELRWDHVGKQYTAGTVPKQGEPAHDGLGDLRTGFGEAAYDNLRNGKIRYWPPLDGPGGTDALENVTFDAPSKTVKPTDPSKPAIVTWRLASPYVFVGGIAKAAAKLGPGGSAQWRYSADKKTWTPLPPRAGQPNAPLEASLDDVVSPRGQPSYQFWLQLVLQGDAAAGSVSFDLDIQTSLLALPELEAGVNQVVYSDSGPSARKVRITHQWLQRTTWRPPSAPAEALAPKDGQTMPGSHVTLRWSPAADPDGDAIVDYHFELSEHADMRWPLSPNFERLTSLTPSQGKPEWTVPSVGLLNPHTDYYWRVRARDATGVWGPWSRTFRFRVAAPGVPLDVQLVPTGDYSRKLTWRPNPQGTPPVAYKIYGSDERGFTASDEPYLVLRGKGFVATMEQYEKKPPGTPDAGMVQTPANLIGRTAELSMPVVGPNLQMPNTNKAYYRVVAVDHAGNESGPSELAEVTRPLVFSPPVTTAQAGKPYHFQLRTIRSLGDLRCRATEKSSYNAAFWDREDHTFSATGLPEGLALDAKTGLISGVPTKPGAYQIQVMVKDQFGRSRPLDHTLTVAP